METEYVGSSSSIHSLVLIYSLKTTDPTYLYSFYASRRLYEEAQRLSLNFSMCLATEFVPERYIPKSTVLLLRGDFFVAFMQELSESGFTLINAPRAHQLCIDKYETAQWLASNAWPHPKTVLYTGGNLFLPCVIKPRYGKMGAGIFLLEHSQSITPAISKLLTTHEYLVQEYIAESYGRDIRFFFASFDEPQAIRLSNTTSAVCVMRTGSGLLSNAHQGGTMALWQPPQPLMELAQEIFSASGLTYGTVDFLFADEVHNQFIVCELNSMPGFETLERATGYNAARAILKACMHAVYMPTLR